MRKLILTSFIFKTSENQHTEQRLVVVNHGPEELESDLLDSAIAQIKNWFPGQYPESELLGIIPHATIGEDSDVQNNAESFTRAALVSFGRYMVSIERTKSISDNHKGEDQKYLEDCLREVYHADFENWLAK